MRAGLAGARRGAILDDLEAGECAGIVEVEVGPHHVDAGGLQPLRSPVGKVTARRFLECPEKIAERRVPELVGLEVVAETGEEVVEADIRDKLLEYRSAFGVGDPVEVHLDGGDVGDVGCHGVCRRQLILSIRPRLLDVGERGPGVLVLGGLGLAQHRSECRERFVEPQVIPPLHGDEIAEPHVGHLVQHGLGAPLVQILRDLRTKDIVLEERHCARILHRARIELGNEELVILAERVRNAEVLVIELESLFGLGEQALGIHELGQ